MWATDYLSVTIMGHVTVNIRLANPVLGLRDKLSDTALVDSGAKFTTIPEATARKLRLKSIGKRKVSTASKSQVLNQSYAYVEIDGRNTVTPLLISKTLDRILLGVITLEALGLSIDPKGRLREAETLLL
jgi:aspartyl protease family protein